MMNVEEFIKMTDIYCVLIDFIEENNDLGAKFQSLIELLEKTRNH